MLYRDFWGHGSIVKNGHITFNHPLGNSLIGLLVMYSIIKKIELFYGTLFPKGIFLAFQKRSGPGPRPPPSLHPWITWKSGWLPSVPQLRLALERVTWRHLEL